MPVMPASVHRALGFRCVIQPCGLVNWQRVHIGAQSNDFAGCVGFAFDHSHNTGAPDAGHNLVAADIIQLLRDNCRRSVRIKQYFRVRVQVLSPCCNFGQKLCKTVLYGHLRLLAGRGLTAAWPSTAPCASPLSTALAPVQVWTHP